MDFFFEDVPSTAPAAAKSQHEDTQMQGCQTGDHDSTAGMSSEGSMTEIQEQHTCSSIDDISRRAGDLVEKINNSRTTDQKMMQDFQEKSLEMMTDMFQQMKEHMYTVYEKNSSDMQVKLQELSETLERCTKLNTELMEASQALACVRESLAISQTAEH